MRFFRSGSLLGFWYDQGRDALVIWDTIYNGKLTLIGPQMGFTGIFRGAWYYWLITPFYALSKGNPLLPYLFLVATTIIAIYVLYLLGKKLNSPAAGIFAAFIAALSMYIVGASRWFSDPTPTLLISVLLVWSLFKFSEGKNWWFIISGFLAGMALQFSAATEVFYIPALMIIPLIVNKKSKLKIKTIFFSVAAFALAFAPQILFEIRHPGVQSSALINFIFHEKTFTYAFWEIIKTRIPFDLNMFASNFWVNGGMFFGPFLLVFLTLLVINWKKFWQLDKFKILFVLAAAPFVGTLFFVSNLGGVYEYYFTGYYLIWILLFAHVYVSSSKNIFMKILIGIFVMLSLWFNLKAYWENYLIPINNLKTVTLANELSAIDWIYKDAAGSKFNVDEYVPPVIPYAYQYLFKWYGQATYKYLPTETNTPLLYTITESDNEHPERIATWYARQNGLSVVLESKTFGPITVERRQRIEK